MKTLLFIGLFSFSGAKSSKVYLCDSPDARKYHKVENCKGLNNCKHEVIQVKLSEAKALGRELCGWED